MFSMSKLILVGLLSASANLVGAIDIYLYDAEHGCSGAAYVCANVNPPILPIQEVSYGCCGNNSNDHHSLAWRAKPPSWSLDLRGHSGGRCSRTTAAGQSGTGSTDICWTTNPGTFPWGDFSGAGYSFRNKRRTTAEGLCPNHDGELSTCGGQQLPDRLDLADGTKYNIAGLTDAERLELRAAVHTEATAADIPAKFDQFKI